MKAGSAWASVDFNTEVAPLIAKRCLECHNERDRKGELTLTTAEGLHRGGESGPVLELVLDVDQLTNSVLLRRLRAGEMPPEARGQSQRLPDSEIATFEAWIRAGAPWPEGRKLDLYETTTDVRAGRDWWSLQPIARPTPPILDRDKARASLHPIDAFIRDRLLELGLSPAPPADAHTLIRRATFDLIGLPPSPEEVEAFVKDSTAQPDAYERLLDRLLDSPHYGERWGRYWLDLVRYAETDGYERDKIKPNVWKYRDWVIDALNADMPYDQFVIHQLAGDEIEAPTESSVRATAMIRAGPWNDEPNDPADYQYERLEDMVHTTSSALMALTVKCARCHDHKFDPILQLDYYRVAANFWTGPIGQANQGGPTAEQLGWDIYGWTDENPNKDPIRLLINGDRHRPGPEVSPAFLSSIPGLSGDFDPPPEDASTSMRRLQFARRIVAPENPLTPRVMVNRLWQHHFGRGIVSTPNNFGFKGALPSHPVLLDWLAAELLEPTVGNGAPWTLKRMHRLIMMSDTYRQASQHPDYARHESRDASNRSWWRFPRQRLDAEALRDAMLQVSGRLNPKMNGPSYYPRMSAEALEGLSRKSGAWGESPETERARRSIYMISQRSRLLPLMTAFDFPDTTATCGRRDSTTVAPQALALLNNGFVHEQSEALAERVMREFPIQKPSAWIERAWQLAFQRPPTAIEQERAIQHWREQKEHFTRTQSLETGTAVDRLALASVCHVLMNTNEFITID